ncbi:MAG: aspartate aminotransferase family protein [Chitinophagales bacterium]|nr:aspartate aminotransferase family protein [Chitinophagales bacterium]MDW8273349.1 aspartate aminotransferase family protein [Chitinophagales bacterium]
MFKQFPGKGLSREEVISRLREMKHDDIDWKRGRVFSLVFYPGDEAANVVHEAYLMYSMENGLNPAVFKSLRKMESEVVAFAADLFHAPETAVGNMTSGGTESIICAVKAAKHYARTSKNLKGAGNIVMPESAHPAFNKAADYLNLEVRTIHCGTEGLEPDLTQLRSAIDDETVMVVGSAPAYPHGHIDPIEELSEIALEKNVWLHVDACVGGFIIPFLELSGVTMPVFDFRLKGVSSLSADIHKYGYGPKGSSIILYRDAEKRKMQFFVYSKWSGGLYISPTVAGTRPGGAIAGAWAVMNFLGKEGYIKMAQATHDAVKKIQQAINEQDEISLVGNPLTTVFSVKSSGKIDIYRLGDALTERGWHTDRQLKPPSLHFTVNYVHVNFAEEFIKDLKECIQQMKSLSLSNLGENIQQQLLKTAVKVLPESWIKKMSSRSIENLPQNTGTPKTAPLYGLAGELSGSGTLDEMIIDLMENMSKPAKE